MNTFITQYRQVVLIAILSFAFVSRVYRLDQPAGYVFDEVYHAVTAKAIARNNPEAFEWDAPAPEPNTAYDWLHPPLAKYTQAAGILVFGENALGWRISAAIFGVGVVYLTYLLAWRLFRSDVVSLLAALLAAFDGLLLAQSRIAMNDIHVTFFIVLAFYLYTWYRWPEAQGVVRPGTVTGPLFWGITAQSPRFLLLTGLALGLAVASKWSGLFAIAVIGLFELVFVLKYLVRLLTAPKRETVASKPWQRLVVHSLGVAVFLLVLPAYLFVGSYWLMFLQGKDFDHFAMLLQQIWWYQTNLEATHAYQSRPWQWFLNLKPVWYTVEYTSDRLRANIYALGNPLLFWWGDVAILSLVVEKVQAKWMQVRHAGARQAWKQRLLDWAGDLNLPALSFLLVSFFLVWLPWVASPRIMFFYHYTPAVPLLAIILAYWLVQLYESGQAGLQGLAKVVITSVVVAFLIFYPHWTALPMPVSFIENVYFVLPSWR